MLCWYGTILQRSWKNCVCLFLWEGFIHSCACVCVWVLGLASLGHMLVYMSTLILLGISHCCEKKNARQKLLKEGSLLCLTVWGYRPPWGGRYGGDSRSSCGGRSLRQAVPQHPQSISTGRWKFLFCLRPFSSIWDPSLGNGAIPMQRSYFHLGWTPLETRS